jgi:predicted dehydrogenase
MTNPLKVAIVGIGWWSTPIGSGAVRSDKLDLAACYTRNPERRAAYAKDFGCAGMESYEDILADDSIEGVLLTTPNTAHASQIEAALRAGKHVWVEKPITNTLAEVPGVLEAWRETGLVLAVGHCYRRAAGHRIMKQLIEDGTVGQPLWAEAAFTNPAGQGFTKDKWRYFKDECPGGPLMQMGIHHCDTLQYLLGKPVRVTGVHKHLATPAEIDDVTMTIYEHESGAVSNVTTCFTSPGGFSMKLHGTEAALSLEMIRGVISWHHHFIISHHTAADPTAHQGRGQGLLSRQKVARSRGLGLPAGPLLPGCARLRVTRGCKRCWARRRKEHCAPKWRKPFIHGGFGWKGHPRGYLFADFMDFLARGTAEEKN